MTENRVQEDTPNYYLLATTESKVLDELSGPFSEQILETIKPFARKSPDAMDVIDIGSGFGFTAMALAKKCHTVLGLEPSATLISAAQAEASQKGVGNIEFIQGGVGDLEVTEQFDLVVLDNVFEHIEKQREALQIISKILRPGGILFMLVPNKLWPIEVHYKLPFLSWLPLPLANIYLRVTRKGHDFQDSSYAPTWFRLRRLFAERAELEYSFTLPANITLASKGGSLAYRLGARLIQLCPLFWIISKALLVVAVKRDANN